MWIQDGSWELYVGLIFFLVIRSQSRNEKYAKKNPLSSDNLVIITWQSLVKFGSYIRRLPADGIRNAHAL